MPTSLSAHKHRLIIVVVALLAFIIAHALWNYYMRSPWTRDSRVRADVVAIAPDVSGFLTELNIKDNQLVHAGDVLFTIDKSHYELALRQAKAVAAASKAKMEQAMRDAKRYDGLKAESISALDRDQKQSAAAISAADYERALADQAVAQLNLDRTTYKAPIDGYVTNADLRIGGYQTAGHPIFALVAADSFYVAAYMEETKLQNVKVGDKAIVRMMGMRPDLTGHVESIARGIVDRERTDGATLLPNVNPTFSWVRLAQRIPVRIALDSLPEGITLVAGQTATVTIEPGENIEMSRRFTLWLMVCSTLSGCMVGPNYHLPSFEMPADWREAKPQATARDTSVAWWQDFHDPILNELMERALKNNENLQTAAARVTEARGLRESANAALFPHIGASADSERGNPGVTTQGGNITVHEASFDATWELDVFGGTRRQVEAQDALIGAREAAYRNAALSLSAEVAREYVTLRQFQKQLAITKQTAQTQQHLYDIAQDRYKGGLVSTLDVAQAQTLYRSTSARLPDFQRQIKASSYRLSVLLGENPGTMDALINQPRPIPAAARLPVLNAPASIIGHRPDVAEAERKLAAATASQGVAISALYPKISLAALFGLQHASLPIAHYEQTENLWSVGASVTMPILEFGSIEGQINAADARQVQAFHQYRQTVLTALGDVETNLSNLTQETRRDAMLRQADESASHAVKVARDRYRSGLTDFTTTLQAEQQHFAVEIDQATSESVLAQDIIALHKALGENPAPAEQRKPNP